jgi:hypothetical protein
MIQDVVADALSVEVAENDEELGQIQTLGRMALLAGTISVGYLSGVLASWIGTRATFAAAMVLPVLVVATLPFVRPRRRPVPTPTERAAGPLGGGKARLVMLVGLGYAAFGAALELLGLRTAGRSCSSYRRRSSACCCTGSGSHRVWRSRPS